MIRRIAVLVMLLASCPIGLGAQERFSFFYPSSPESVERMLTLAALQDNDVVLDLGSGDGLIPLTAAKMNPRLRGRGVDIDEKLVAESNLRAREAGVADRVRFTHQNAFDADLSEATVITMWLFPELMRLLRPIILERARPGTRVLTNSWNLGTWTPDASNPQGTGTFMWIVPAKVAGAWDWSLDLDGRALPYSALLDQQFQMIEGVARVGNRREVFTEPKLRGDQIALTLEITVDGLGLTKHDLNGTVNGDLITGTATVTPSSGSSRSVPWRAIRSTRSGYFAPTGTVLPRSAPAAQQE